VRKLTAVCLLLVFCLFASAQKPLGSAAAADGDAIGQAAVWKPKPKDEQKVFADMRQCGAMHAGGSPGTFETCVGWAMEKGGAPPAAIAFNRATGGNAYATRFRELGRVDVMEAMNPFLANSNDQVYFVNGDPAAVGADEQAMKLDVKSNPGFLALAKRYPEAFLFPHAEMHTLSAPMTHTGQAFTLDFPIVNGCHACERVGKATITYFFDSNGKYTGAEITAVEAMAGE
jgi:hypothetical protein